MKKITDDGRDRTSNDDVPHILRNLDVTNAVAKSTKTIFTVSLVIPIVMGWEAWALAEGAAPMLALHDNYLAMIGLGIVAASIIALPLPYIFRWNWETKYFGAGFLSMGSGSLMGLYPVLCIAMLSSLPLVTRLALLLLDGALVLRWCSRFVNVYREIYRNQTLFRCIYVEELTAVYYLSEGEKKVIGKCLKFEQFPDSKYAVFSILAAFSLTPFSSSIERFIGLPFIHVFLAVGAAPLTFMFLGLSTKMWLAYYFYPRKIQKATNKRVFVDMSSHPDKYAYYELQIAEREKWHSNER